jgi:hypothetical protein
LIVTKKLGLFALAFVGIAITHEAQALWVSTAKVTRVREYAPFSSGGVNYVQLDLWFDRAVASGCADNNKAQLRLNVATFGEGVTEGARQVAITAMLSGREVEVNTIGCSGNYGKLDYISLK